MAKPLPTLEDVAQLAGFSPATVSRCLNAPHKLSHKTRQKIESAITTLGYVPNALGRGLASHQSNIVGALIPSLSNAMFANGVQAFQETLAAQNLALILATTGYDLEEEARQARNLVSQGASGLLLIGKAQHGRTLEFLASRHIPYVLSWCFDRHSPHPHVGFNNQTAARIAAEHVVGYGHRHIGLICGLSADNDRAQDRQAGYRQAVAAAGGQTRISHCLEAPYSLESGRLALQELMATAPETTAVLCGNDVLAAGAMMAAREQGLQVPKDVSIVGFDDIGLAAVLSPALTTVRVPQTEMGRLAAEALIRLRHDASATASVELNTDFILRGTLAAPRPPNISGPT